MQWEMESQKKQPRVPNNQQLRGMRILLLFSLCSVE